MKINTKTKVKASDINEKIAFGLERISQIFRILLWEKAKKFKLSPIQIQFLLYLNNHKAYFCTVSNLAEEFGLTRATVSDAVKALVKKKLLLKRASPKDGRIFILELSREGKKIADELENWISPVKEQLEKFPEELKNTLLLFLMEFIASFQNRVINIARMCVVCRYFKKNAHPGNKKPHHCLLTDQPLALSDLKLDCENNEPKIKNKSNK